MWGRKREAGNIEVSSGGEAALEIEALEPENKEAEQEDLKKSKLSSVYKAFRKKLVPAILEGSNKAWKVFNEGVDVAAKVVNEVVPGATEFVTGFILPEHFGRIINKTVEKTTKAATFIGKNVAKVSANVFVFGAPAWIEAFRSGLAVVDANQELNRAKSGVDLTAINFLEHLKDEKTRDSLREYYDLRERLAQLREDPEKNAAEIKELAGKIAFFEVNYKDNADFSNLKAILENSREFIENNESLIQQLAEETADKMIANVENFYKDKVGGLADKVEGGWLNIITSPEAGRKKLVGIIAERLKSVMNAEVGKDEVQKELKNITRELLSAFAVYRKCVKAAMYLILREMPLVKQGLESIGVWDHLAEAAHKGLDTVSDLAGEGAKKVMSWIWESAKDGMGKVTTFVSEKIKEFILEIVEDIKKEMTEVYSSVNEVMEEAAEATKEVAMQNTINNMKKAGEIFTNGVSLINLTTFT